MKYDINDIIFFIKPSFIGDTHVGYTFEDTEFKSLPYGSVIEALQGAIDHVRAGHAEAPDSMIEEAHAFYNATRL